MKKKSILIFTILIVVTFAIQTGSAQITITIPKIPKIKKDKTEPPKSEIRSDDFDKLEFENFVLRWGEYMESYLACYAKKHNLDLEKVGGKGFNDPFYTVYEQMEERLTREQKDMAEIEVQLKEKFKSRPDNGLPYEKNPAIWEEIATNRAEYLQCALKARKGNVVKSNLWLETHLEEIANRQKEVESFTPERGWFVKTFTYDHVLNAISPQARAKWLTDSKATEFKQYLDPPLDALAAAIEKKMASNQPNTKAYPIHNPVEEKLMKSKINDLSNHKIHYIGLQQSNWLIEKNELGIPKNRYKYGMAWVRYAPNDHPYCRVYYINIIQDYAGGGTYSASYAYFAKDELFGCPAGK